ncbi:MAG: TraB/GumN family protein [Myxococcota bacterium]
MLLALLACAPKVAPVPPQENPLLLWELQREGKTSHLLGTCHLGVPLDYALPEPHDRVLDEARVVYTEAELDMDDVGRLFRLVWSDGPGLSERIPDDRWRAVAIAVRDQMPAPFFEHLEPWVLASMVPMFAAKSFDRAKEAMDLEIQKRAKARGIRMAHVETLEEQAAMLRAFDDAFLADLGPSEEDGAAQTEALTALCLRADTSVADVLLDPGDPTSEALLATRNRAWVPNLLPDLKEGGALVAVGAAHVLGDAGLLALLSAEGFTVRQLTTTRPVTGERMPAMSARIAPAPPLPPGIEAFEAQMASALPAALCAEGQLVRKCFEPDLARCTERLAADTRLCVRQHADLLPADGSAPSEDVVKRLGGCVPGGLMIEAIARDRVGDAPMCRMIEGMMQSAAGK